MKLEDLVGSHQLSGVDEVCERMPGIWEPCNVLRFKLDGITYKAIEDPEDGYRSCLWDLDVSEDKLTNTFPQHHVVGVIQEVEHSMQLSGILQFIDVTTGKPVLEIGTDLSDEYYPCCVMHWIPENLAINASR